MSVYFLEFTLSQSELGPISKFHGSYPNNINYNEYSFCFKTYTFWKIGYSANVIQRFKEVCKRHKNIEYITAYVLEGGRKEESNLHSFFQNYRIFMEYYLDIDYYIQELLFSLKRKVTVYHITTKPTIKIEIPTKEKVKEKKLSEIQIIKRLSNTRKKLKLHFNAYDNEIRMVKKAVLKDLITSLRII